MKYKETPLKDITAYISKGIVPKYASQNDTNIIRVLNQRCNRNNLISLSNSRFNNLDKRNVPNEKVLKENDVLINSTGVGTAGRVAQVNDLKEKMTVDGHMIIIRPTKTVNPVFYGYAVIANQYKIEQLAEGSTGQTEINRDRLLKDIYIKLPSLDIQNKIANNLRILDNKISLNNQINANLDEIKTAYFDKSFNQQMQSNLNGKLKNITKITSGKRPNKKSDTKSSKDKYPIVGASKVMGYTDNYLYNEPILTTGRVGTHGIIQRFREPVWVSDNSFVFKTDHEDYLFEILNHWINYSALNRGSTQPLITQTDLKNIDIYVPTESELKKFERVSRILTNLQFSLIKQNRRLDQIKKTLLNKLLL